MSKHRAVEQGYQIHEGEPRRDERGIPSRRLWVAVLEQAIIDTQDGIRGAAQWWASEACAAICGALGLDHGWILRGVAPLIAGVKPAPRPIRPGRLSRWEPRPGMHHWDPALWQGDGNSSLGQHTCRRCGRQIDIRQDGRHTACYVKAGEAYERIAVNKIQGCKGAAGEAAHSVFS